MDTRAAALIERAERMLAEFNRWNAPAVAAFYADDAVLIAPDGTRAEGRSAIADRLSGLLDSRKLRMETNPRTAQTDGALGYMAGTYVLWSGDEPISRGSYVEVWKCVDGTWRIVVDAMIRTAA